jgi:Acetyltransferase (GNAT) domain
VASPLEVCSDWCPISHGPSGAYFVQLAETAEEVEMLRPTWQKWAHSLDSDIDYFLHEIRHDPESLQPLVITVHDGQAPQAMLVGVIKSRKASSVVSFVNISGPRGRVLEIKKGGRIGRPSPAIDALLAAELFATCRSRKVDSISFERLPLESELFRQIQKLGGLLVRERVPHVFRYSTLALDAGGENPARIFLAKARREIRRKTRIVDRDFPGGLQLKCFSGIDELDAAMSDAMRIAVTTWQYDLGLGLIDTARTRETLRFQARRNWLRIFVLYLKGMPCAFLVGQLYESTFHCQYAGFHPGYTRYSVGSLLTARAFEELASAGVRRVDLGDGGQEHHRRLGCTASEEGSVQLFSDSVRGIGLSAFFGITHAVRSGGRRTRTALRLGSLGKLWRQYRSRQSRSGSEIFKSSHRTFFSNRERATPGNVQNTFEIPKRGQS